MARIVRGKFGVLMGKPERNRPLGRPKWRCEDNIKINVKSVRRASIVLIWLWDRVKVNFALEEAMKPQRGSESIALLFL